MSHYKPYPAYKDSGVEWLGQVPELWHVKKLKWLASLQSGDFITGESIEDDGAYPVFGGNGLRGYAQSFTHDGHYALIGRQGALCGNINYADGKFWASEHAVVVSPYQTVATKWLGEMLRTMNLNQYSVSAAQPGLAVERVTDLYVSVPALGEQLAIAAHLGHETTRIDALVEKKTRFIELLREKRQALITHAVTKGLDPNAKMKDSGVEWLGEVPENWSVLPLRRGMSFLTDYEANGSFADTKENVSLDAGEPFAWYVRATDLENGNLGISECTRYCDEKTYIFLKKTALRGGELLIAKRGEIGKVYIMPETCKPATLAPNLYLIRLNKLLLPEFAFYWFTSSYGRPQLELADKSTTIGALYKDDVRDIICTFPPASEQKQIVESISGSCTRLKVFEEKVEKSIQLLKERRSALIIAAVTGQIDLREAV
ncbi:restriction endonuclease subunit S [Pseudomonas mandelii]|uniref:restriction endonuclease subunit S n=1 Tax=Pseudomonas mandelii TaxID=75612 RepID=UPI00398D248C